jgi:hypothetical protein
MTRGIVFYLMGNAYDAFVPPALYSLRKVYSGPIHVVCAETTSSWLRSELPALPGVSVSHEQPNKYTGSGHKTYVWCRKVYHHMGDYPFDINLYFDMDHIWQQPMDGHPIFETCEKAGMVCCSSGNPPPKAEHKMGGMNRNFNINLSKIYSANGGCLCTKKGDPLIQELLRRTDLALKADEHFLRHNPEEFSIASMISEGIIERQSFESISYPISRKCFTTKVFGVSGYNIHGTRGSLPILQKFWDFFDGAVAVNFMDINTLLKNPTWSAFSQRRSEILEET